MKLELILDTMTHLKEIVAESPNKKIAAIIFCYVTGFEIC